MWQGKYMCAQGSTNLQIGITQAEGNVVQATFNFDHGGSRNCSGSYVLSGVYSGE